MVLSLTEEGARQVAEGDRVVAERLEKLLDRLPADDAEGALRGLESLNAAMEAYMTEKFGRPGGAD